MKELSIEEKARAYDEAIKKAESLYKASEPMSGCNVIIETLFPELKKSEEERIRTAIIHFISHTPTVPKGIIGKETMLAWLKRQAEQKPVVIIPKFRIGDNIKTTNEEPLTITKIDEKGYWSEDLFICDFDEECIWDLVEQKPDDKVDPKFHEGDWVVYNNDICQIVKREEGCNKLVTIFGIEKELVNERNLSTARFWNIQDARKGDILVMQKTNVTYESIFIFNKIENNRIIQYLHYFTTDANEEVCEARSTNGFLGFVGTTVHPATKEQGDLLFLKMKEAGYEWDAEKKELKKIEQKPSDKEMKTLLCTEYEKGRADVIAEMQIEWSKGDERMLHIIIADFKGFIRENTSTLESHFNECIEWLKSLRPQKHWKPRDEQMRVLDLAIRCGINRGTTEETTLVSLFNDLKKLIKL